MRTVKEIEQEIREAESAQAETEFSSTMWDSLNAEIIGLHAELKRASNKRPYTGTDSNCVV